MSGSSCSVRIPVTFSGLKVSVFVLDQNHVVIVRLSVASTKKATPPEDRMGVFYPRRWSRRPRRCVARFPASGPLFAAEDGAPTRKILAQHIITMPGGATSQNN